MALTAKGGGGAQQMIMFIYFFTFFAVERSAMFRQQTIVGSLFVTSREGGLTPE